MNQDRAEVQDMQRFVQLALDCGFVPNAHGGYEFTHTGNVPQVYAFAKACVAIGETRRDEVAERLLLRCQAAEAKNATLADTIYYRGRREVLEELSGCAIKYRSAAKKHQSSHAERTLCQLKSDVLLDLLDSEFKQTT